MTPRALEVDESYETYRQRMQSSGNPKNVGKTKPGNLSMQAKMWPTPTANEDACGTPSGKMQRMLGKHPEVRNTGQGTLNPDWVELLMGYPAGWTCLDDGQTDLGKTERQE